MSKKRLAFRTAEAQTFYDAVAAEYELSAHHVDILRQAADTIDRIDYSQRILKEAGDYFLDKFGQPKAHPATRTLRDDKIVFARLCRELALDDDASASDIRIPRIVKQK